MRVRFGGDPADALQQRLAAAARQHEAVAAACQLALRDHQQRLETRRARRAHPAQHGRGACAHLRRRVAGDVGAGQPQLVQEQNRSGRIVGRHETHHDMLGGLAHLRLLEPLGGPRMHVAARRCRCASDARLMRCGIRPTRRVVPSCVQASRVRRLFPAHRGRSPSLHWREPRTAGKRILPCPPPGLSTGLPLYFQDSLPRHPQHATAVVFEAEHNERSL